MAVGRVFRLGLPSRAVRSSGAAGYTSSPALQFGWCLLLGLSLVLAACGDHVSQVASASLPTPSPSASVVPWVSTAPVSYAYVRATAAPIPSAIPRCDSSALRLDPGTYQGAMGSWAGLLYLENTTSTPCLVEGPFQVRFIAQSGQLALVVDVKPFPAAQSSPLTPGWALAGRAQIQWQAFWCDRADPIVAIEIGYSGTTYRAPQRPFTGGTACDFATTKGNASVWPFGPAPTPVPSPSPPSLRARIEAPLSVRAGDALVYRVILTNVGDDSVLLDPCPSYLEWLGGRPIATTTPPPNFPSSKPWVGRTTYAGAVKESYSLNCAAVKAIDAGASVTFEMRLAVPMDALGQETLRWSLAGPLQDVASAPLSIESAR